MKDIMIDIETLSTASDAAVIAIGMCQFDEHTISNDMTILIDPALTPGHRSESTLQFWSEQDPAVFADMMAGELTPWEGMAIFTDTIQQWADPETRYWANSPSFDFIILKHLHQTLFPGDDFPMPFWKEMDFRTLRGLADVKNIGYMTAYEDHQKHDCLSDAICQAKAVQLILASL